MSQSRHQLRQTAFQVLYSLYFNPAASLDELAGRFCERPDPEHEVPRQESGHAVPKGFAWDLVRGVWEHQDLLDNLITGVARRGMDRIGRIETVILRLAGYEMLAGDAEMKIIISEAVILANEFADDRPRKFINGTLNGMSVRVQQEHLTLADRA